MRVRFYEPTDLSATAEILAIGNKTDTLGRYIYKNVEKYPTSYRLAHIRFVRSRILGVGAVCQVVETETSDYPAQERYKAPEIVGFAVWCRRGTSDVAREWQAASQTWTARLDQVLYRFEDSYYRLFPSALPTWAGEKYAKILPTLMEYVWDPQIFAERWELQLLFILPNWQRRGIARRLMNFGFETAQDEKVPIVLKSSPLGGAAYRKMGFRSLKDIKTAGFFDPLEFGGEVSKAWVWEPVIVDGDAVEGHWYERAKALVDREESGAASSKA